MKPVWEGDTSIKLIFSDYTLPPSRVPEGNLGIEARGQKPSNR